MKRKFEIIGLCIGWFAVVTQFLLMLQNRQTDIPEMLIRFFSFFTILTNLLVALFFTRVAFQLKWTALNWLSSKGSITAITAFILIVGLVYQVALRAVWQPTGLQQLVDELLHTIIPIYMLIYWSFKVTKNDLYLKSLFQWLLYPLLFIVIILARGHVSGYYPYPFLNVSEIGYNQALLNIGIIFATCVVMLLGLRLIGQLIIKKQSKNS